MWGGVGGLVFYSWSNCMSEQVARRDLKALFWEILRTQLGKNLSNLLWVVSALCRQRSPRSFKPKLFCDSGISSKIGIPVPIWLSVCNSIKAQREENGSAYHRNHWLEQSVKTWTECRCLSNMTALITQRESHTIKCCSQMSMFQHNDWDHPFFSSICLFRLLRCWGGDRKVQLK